MSFDLFRMNDRGEFICHLVRLWAYANGVTMQFSRQGKPTDNAFIESINGSLRDEWLYVQWFDELTGAKMKLHAWQRESNETRPNRALKELSPQEYRARRAQERSATC